MDVYLLPSHPSLISTDPLGLCDEENPTVWSVVSAAIHSFRAASKVQAQDLPNLIKDLTYSIHMDGKINTQYLSHFLGSNCYESGYSAIVNNILDDALLLPTMFPTHTIHYLNAKNPFFHLSMQQIRSLLASPNSQYVQSASRQYVGLYIRMLVLGAPSLRKSCIWLPWSSVPILQFTH